MHLKPARIKGLETFRKSKPLKTVSEVAVFLKNNCPLLLALQADRT